MNLIDCIKQKVSIEDLNQLSEGKGWTRNHILARGCNIINVAIKTNYFDAVVWMVDKFSITKDDILWRDPVIYQIHRENPFITAVCAGKLEIVKWMVDRFNITKDDVDINTVLHNSISTGHLDVTKWLVTYFNLTINYVRSGSLHKAVHHKHIDTITWLFDTFEFTADFIRIEGFFHWCINNHGTDQRIAALLVFRFGLEDDLENIFKNTLCNEDVMTAIEKELDVLRPRLIKAAVRY